jgi:hypothetical protein
VLLGLPPARRARAQQRAAGWEAVRAFGPVRVRAEEVRDVFDLPDWLPDRIAGMARFSRHLTQANGQVPQFGDNDNGRFIKLIPEWPTAEPLTTAPEEEDHLCQAGLVAALDALLPGSDAVKRPEGAVVRALAGGQRLTAAAPTGADTAGVAYRDFGLYRLANDVFTAWVRCGAVGQNGNGGHAHNDQLSLVLTVGGLSLLVDPGTYLYTPLPHHRNAFRSPRRHNTLHMATDPLETYTPDRNGLFRMAEVEEFGVRQFDARAFCGWRQVHGVGHTRTLRLDGTTLRGQDECTADGEKIVCFHLHPDITARLDPQASGTILFSRGGVPLAVLQTGADRVTLRDGWYSACYGRVVSSRYVEIRFRGPVCTWDIRAAGR